MEDFREKQKLHRKKVKPCGTAPLGRRGLVLPQRWAVPGRYLLPCPSPRRVLGSCGCREVPSSFLHVATTLVKCAATSSFLLLAAVSSPLGGFWGQ